MSSTTAISASPAQIPELASRVPSSVSGTPSGGREHPTPRREQNRGGQGARGGSRGRTANRGRGSQQASNPRQPPARMAPLRPPPDDLGGGGVSGSDPTGDAATKSKEVNGMGTGMAASAVEAGDDDEGAEVCFICASPVVHNSVAPCNHRTCHICALRLRALYKSRACAHCRTESKFVIFTDDANKRFEEFTTDDIVQTDETLGIKYAQKEINADTLLLLRYNCPEATCDVACWGWPDLHRHVKGLHHKVLCDLCTRNKKVFTHEHELFTAQELKKHEKFGDDHPGAIDQSGFKGHPECGFCRQRFYGDDELFVHCRDKHERCHICDRQRQSGKQEYFVDYNSLEQHFRKEHLMCPDQECLEKKFVVFASEMDLKAHQLEAHPNGLTKDARRDARRVDMSGFDYRAPHQEPHRGRGDREGRTRGRGRDPNTEALPQSTAQPMRRDEVAYQRQMAIQSAQSVTTRTFGGQLTAPTDAYAARPTAGTQATTLAPQSRTATNPSFPAIDNLNLGPSTTTNSSGSNTPTPSLTPQQQARQLQHTAIIDRAFVLLGHDQGKLSSFRDGVSTYRASKMTAPQLIDSFFSLFDVASSELGKLVKELADLYENAEKRNSLLKAWNDWRAINEDYPSLPGPSGVIPGSTAAAAGSGGHRVLKLKSSTAQSSRSAVSRHGSWGHAAGSANAFPAISNTGSIARIGTSTPWVSSARPAHSNAPLTNSSCTPTSSRPTTSSNNASRPAADAFPALPAAAKPNTLMAGKTRGSIRWDEGRGNPTANPWGPPNDASSLNTYDQPQRENEAPDPSEVLSKKKGKQGKKQVLYQFG